jgi:hypothetical protein
MKLRSAKKPRKTDIWVTEINVKDKNITPALIKLIGLVRRYESLS